ncbi:M14 family zinc carboxypeptidase [Oceanobacillus sp. J11TS1]|uniref:M14 family zinc carboxypeptidase n=1 Tax=Oceanobacillus sp. J11TS1 TaxID=2807191 RepID=UPI001B25371B|nr:M14 family zinc carboxypeptidase [Oceanobacillus sp. J11TS1]GIO23447.1 hypothetical protein J11TS1_20280 [Oceanobacillus sp. J11TS1]
MKNLHRKKLLVFVFVLPLIYHLLPMQGSAEGDLPTTGFEETNGERWTTFEEEQLFLQELDKLSERITYKQIGESVEGRPLHLAKIAYPSPPSDESIETGRSILIMGTQHGNEPSGREMALKVMRDLAFTEDPEILEMLSKSTVLIIPTVNPDGREADRRISSEGVDLNRDQLELKTPEGQIIASVLNQYQPDLTLDAHERIEGPNVSLLGPTSLNVYDGILALNDELITDFMVPDIEEAGLTTGPYPGTGAPRTVRNIIGLRHGLGILVETTWVDDFATRVEGQMAAVESVFRFYQERFVEIGEVVEEARVQKEEAGRNQSEPYYLNGSAGDDPSKSDILDPPPYGYLLNNEQAEEIRTQIELFSLDTEQVSENGVFISMAQPMMTVIPFIMDERSDYRLVEGIALYDPAIDPGSIAPPALPEPLQFSTDFSEDEVGSPPDDWSPLWRESGWTVMDNPSRLQHAVTENGGRRVLAWDKVGDIRGDVEVSALVRANGGNSAMFQVQLLASEEKGHETSYYLDILGQGSASIPNHIRINRNFDSRFLVLETVELPFEVKENNWYQVVFQREGDLLRGKVWPYGEDEPENWQITAEDRFINIGKIGVGHVTTGMVNDWAYFSVGTAGASAPRVPENILPEIDKSLPQYRVNEINAEGLSESNFTVESWGLLVKSLSEAEEILANSEATQEEVDQVLSALNQAYAGLKSAPAQFETDFSKNNVGETPSDWTRFWNDSNWTVRENPIRLEHDVEAGGRSALAWDLVGEIRGDVEVAGLVKAFGNGTTLFQLPLHISGNSGSENSYYLDLRTAGTVRINRNLNSGFTTLKNKKVPFTVEEDTWYQAVLQREGNMLRGKVWPFGEAEPEEWQVEVVDESHDRGYVGFSHVSDTRVNDWAYFGVGVGGEPAPRAPEDIFKPS